MIRYTCPHCGEQLEAPASVSGEDVQCPRCGNRTVVPKLVARATGPSAQVYGHRYVSPAGITAPVLISAIGNIVVGLAWAATCFGIVLTIPMVILCVFEFSLYAQAGRLPPPTLARKAKTLGIFEVIVGLFNLISLVCGIIVLINAGKIEIAQMDSSR